MASLKRESGISRSSGRAERTSISRFSRSAAVDAPAAASKKKFLLECTPLEYDLQGAAAPGLWQREGVHRVVPSRDLQLRSRLVQQPRAKQPIASHHRDVLLAADRVGDRA